MSYLGTTNLGGISKMYLGDVEVGKAYLGNDIAYENAPPYDAEIEYLQSTGTQYFDTGIVGGSNFECEIKAEYTQNQDGFDTILGAFTSTGHFSVALAIQKAASSNKPYFQFGSTYVLHTTNPLALHVYKTSLKNGVVKIDIDGSAVTDTYSAELSDLTMYMFARHRGDTTIGNYSKAKIYYCKIWSNGSLVRDYIPVRVGQVGYMYDRVSGQLFGNAGTGSFTLGNDKQ